MNPIQIFLCLALALVITWVLGSMAADAWAAFSARRKELKVGTAGWYHPGRPVPVGASYGAITDHWPAGEMLRVYNSAGTFVDVRVASLKMLPNEGSRVLLHLDRRAFARLAPLGVDFLHVMVERLAPTRGQEAFHQAEREGVLE